MEIWLDTINKDLIRKAQRLGILHGVTTNPSIIAAAQDPLEKVLHEVLELQEGPVTVQVIASDTKGMVKQALALHQISKRLYIKIPPTESGIEAIHLLSGQNVPTVATIIFHPNQVLLAAYAGAHYVAPYISSIEKEGEDAFEILKSMKHILKEYNFKTKILAASIKSTEQIRRCLDLGIHAMTLKADIFQEFTKTHKLTTNRLELFLDDWKKAQPSTILNV